MFETVVASVPDATVHLASLRASAAELLDRVSSCAQWSAPARAAALSSLDLVVAALSRARADLLVAERDAGTSQRPGDRSFEAARARIGRTGTAEATREVRQADALVSMPTVAAAVVDGRVGLGHLDALARVAATASPEVAQTFRSAEMQASVVQMAAAQSVPDFARSLAQLAAARDPQALEDSHQAIRRERSLVLSHQARGTYLKGFLDRVAGEALQVALDSAGQVPDETRTPEQARADALVAVVQRACAGLGPARAAARRVTGDAQVADTRGGGAAGRDSRARADGAAADAVLARPRDTGPVDLAGAGVEVDAGHPVGAGVEVDGGLVAGSGSRPHVSLIVPVETFAALRDHYRKRERDGADDGDAPTVLWPTVAPATLEDGTPVAMSELAQALCDCEITRIVLSEEGVPLDLGRTKRTYAGVHRRAVVARDRQCAWNGCQASARWAQVHHIRWWDRDRGSTSIENGVLLCDYHHHEVHRLDLTIERHTKPPGTVRRQRASGRPPDPAPPFAPARYTFRRRRDGRTVNAPDPGPAGRGAG